MKIYFISYEAAPVEGSENQKEYGGSIITGWVKADCLEKAEECYKQTIYSYGWVAQKVEKTFETSENDYKEFDEGLEYFQQAKIDDEVYVIHTWPNEL